jgi:hypothetical protein
MPRALIGPDVDVRVLCDSGGSVPIASVDELGAGVTKWSFTVNGDAAFGHPTVETFVTCEANSPQVAFVNFSPPMDALPGATFDAIAAVHADDGSFADGTVKLHGEVTAPVLTVDKARVDFGNVAPGDNPTIPLHFTREYGVVNPFPQSPDATSMSGGVVSYSYGPFDITPMKEPGSSFVLPLVWNVTFTPDVPSDYSATVGWRATPSGGPGVIPGVPTACNWTTTISLHARVVGDGGADADTADPSDGPTVLALDAP